MTGIQALERPAPSKPMRPGCPERREHEYIRHGTLSLIANFNVATGEVLTPSLGPTRTAADFADHIARTIDTDPEARWLFLVDNLNTHRSEALVRLVADRCGLAADLGMKGQEGVYFYSTGVLRPSRTATTVLAPDVHRAMRGGVRSDDGRPRQKLYGPGTRAGHA